MRTGRPNWPPRFCHLYGLFAFIRLTLDADTPDLASVMGGHKDLTVPEPDGRGIDDVVQDAVVHSGHEGSLWDLQIAQGHRFRYILCAHAEHSFCNPAFVEAPKASRNQVEYRETPSVDAGGVSHSSTLEPPFPPSG